jgi:catechol 2,3-dioxygenase-like lactoylglutathione lyase family enzyme
VPRGAQRHKGPWNVGRSGDPQRVFWQALQPQPTTDEEGIVRVTGITANLPVADIATAREFYRDYLGLSEEAMNLGWVARYTSADGRASVQLVSGDASAPQDSVISVHVGSGVDEAYAEARRRGYEIVHPLTDEPWGVRRFFVRAPDGNIINIVSHSDE